MSIFCAQCNVCKAKCDIFNSLSHLLSPKVVLKTTFLVTAVLNLLLAIINFYMIGLLEIHLEKSTIHHSGVTTVCLIYFQPI